MGREPADGRPLRDRLRPRSEDRGRGLALTRRACGGGTLFGAPDIALERGAEGGWTVRLRGVDAFDFLTGEVLLVRRRWRTTSACWFIDTDYAGDSVFVRRGYFLGGKDPCEKLKAALCAGRWMRMG